MAFKPRDFAAEKEALLKRARAADLEATRQLGQIVQFAGGDALPPEALAGAILAAVEQGRKQPEAVARWAERGQALFLEGTRRGKQNGASEPVQAGHGSPGTAAPPHRHGS